jgi:deoxycytidine triphosphate deaminase
MALAGTELRRALADGTWKAYRDEQPISADDLKMSAHSVDVTLDRRILRVLPVGRAIDPRDPSTMRTEAMTLPNVPNGGFVLKPGDFVLGATRERFECSAPLECSVPASQVFEPIRPAYGYYSPNYEGRSSCARLGITSHLSAGYGDWKFGDLPGQCFTLELTAAVPVILFPGMRIGQVVFESVHGICEGYDGAYQQSEGGPVAAVLGANRF